MSQQYKLHVLPGSSRSQSCMLILNLAKIDYELVAQSFGSLKDESYLKIHPFGKAPALEGPEVSLFESGAIARWAARRSQGLYGSNDQEAAQVDQWYDWVRTTLYTKVGAFTYSIFGLDVEAIPKHDENSFKQAVADFVAFLKPVEAHLSGKSYLVGNQITIADAAFLADLNIAYKFVLTKEQRDSLPNLTKYFTELVNKPEVAAVLRGFKPIDAPLKIKYAGKQQQGKQQGKQQQQQPKKKEEKKEEKKPAAKKDDDIVEEKKKEPEFPATNFDMHSFKTFFVNEPDAQVKMDKLFEQFDDKALAFWHLTYDKLPSECKKLFLTNNLMSGFVDRAAHMRKYCFGVHGVYGEPDNYNIRGVWLGRGTEELPLITEHAQHDVYKIRKLDPKNDDDKKIITEYFTKKNEDTDVVEGETLRTFSYVL